MLSENAPVPQDRRVSKEAWSLAANGYAVSIICPAFPGQPLKESIEGVEVRRYRATLGSHGKTGQSLEYLNALVKTLWLMIRLLRSPGFDVIHAGNPPDLFFLIVWPFKLLGKRFIFDQHDLTPELYSVLYGRDDGLICRVLRWSERLSYGLSDAVIVCNESYRKLACFRGLVPADRVFLVRNGPRSNWPKPVPPDVSLKSGRRFLVVYMGVMGYQDGVDVLLQAVHILVHTLEFRDATFALVGDGSAVESLREQVKALGIEEYVDFAGWISDENTLSTYLLTADACVCPEPSSPLNDHSTFIKVMEYMSSGSPIVAFDLTETKVSAEDAAVYATPGDVEGLAQRIRDVLTDPALASRMKASAAERMPSLRWESQVPALLAAYDCALRRPRSARCRQVRHSAGQAHSGSPIEHFIGFWRPMIETHEMEAMASYRDPEEPLAGGINVWRVSGEARPYRIRDGEHEFSLFAAVRPIEEAPPAAEVVADILDRTGQHHSYVLWFPEQGSLVVPFDTNAAVESFWREEHVPGRMHTLLPRPLLSLYYAARPLLPAAARLPLRRMMLGRALSADRLLDWPSDDSLDSLQRLMLRSLMLVSERRSLKFTWFWPNGHSWAAVLTHDVETADGLARVPHVAELERSKGLRSSFNLVPRDYEAPRSLLATLREDGFEVGVHGYTHDGLLFSSPRIFAQRGPKINEYVRQWNASGFRSPATYRNWEWMRLLELEYDSSVADTAPFEPQPGGCASFFPYFVDRMIELPMTLPQDHTLFGLLGQDNANQWFNNLDRIRCAHGMACALTHPDPTNGYIGQTENEAHYRDLLDKIAGSDAWVPLPRDLARWWRVRAAAAPEDIGQVAGLALGTAMLDESGRLQIVPPAAAQESGQGAQPNCF